MLSLVVLLVESWSHTFREEEIYAFGGSVLVTCADGLEHVVWVQLASESDTVDDYAWVEVTSQVVPFEKHVPKNFVVIYGVVWFWPR